MRSKDLAKASGLAVVFDLTAHTFYRLSRKKSHLLYIFITFVLHL